MPGHRPLVAAKRQTFNKLRALASFANARSVSPLSVNAIPSVPIDPAKVYVSTVQPFLPIANSLLQRQTTSTIFFAG
jgi:hypothetical protein